MKILMLNSKNSHLLAPQYFKALKDQGIEVYGSYYIDFLSTFIKNNILNKALFRLFPSLIYFICNAILLKDFNQVKPHIVLIFKGMEIFPSTLKKLKKRGSILVNYNLDHPFNFVSPGSGNSNVKNSIPLYHLHLSYSNKIIKDLIIKYPSIKTAQLPFGIHDDALKTIEVEREIIKIAFIGYWDKKREKIIKTLLENGFPVDVFGPKWEKSSINDHHNLNIEHGVYGQDYWNIIRKYRIQLNILREHNEDSHNMRTFEIPGVGGIMLSEFTEEQNSFFENGKQAFYYSTSLELISITHKLLNMSVEKIYSIRKAAELKSIEKGYTYKDRSKQLISILKSLIND